MSLAIERSDDDEHRIVCGRRAIVAAWDRDRWQLGLLENGEPLLSMPARSSVDDELDLPGPVFQQCFPRITDDQCGELLLVGQCGRRHFSAVFTLAANEASFEIADRWSTPLPIRRIVTTWTSATPTLPLETVGPQSTVQFNGFEVRVEQAVPTSSLPPGTRTYGWRLRRGV